MNYYEHHIGDYAEATGQLSFVEDAAYSRLIRKYYASEKPLPADLKQVQRLVGARTKEERDAVATALEEFFYLLNDGWHNTRCDDEIAIYKDKQAKAKRSAETRWSKQKTHSVCNANAMRTHLSNTTESEKKIFSEGLPEKNKFSDCYIFDGKNINRSMNGTMRTHCDGNAHQTPDTRHQTPDICVSNDTHIAREQSPPPTKAAAVCVALRAEGIDSVNPSNPDLLALLENGAEVQDFVGAARIARDRGKGFHYAIGIVKGQRAEAQRVATQAMPKTRQGGSHDRHDVEEPV